MRINSRKRQLLLIGAIFAGIIVALLFINLYEIYWFTVASYGVTLFIDIILGTFLVIAVGMLFSEDSRINGILFFITLLFITNSFLSQERIILEGLYAGLFLGVLIISLVVLGNRFDLLATSARILLTFSFLIITGYLIYGFIIANQPEAFGAPGGIGGVTAQNIFFYGLGILISTVFYVLLLSTIVGVKASDIFIFGPRESGKTYFFLGLYSHITRRYHGSYREVILSGDEQDEVNLKLANLSAKTIAGEVVPRTFNYHMGMYQLLGRKFGILPVKWTVVDYAGEYYDQLHEENFEASLGILSRELGIPSRELEKKIGSIEFLQEVNDRYADKLTDIEITRSLIIGTVYARLQRAGKVIFLIDGEKIVNSRDGTAKLAREFGEYVKTLIDLEGGKILRLFGGSKKYALTVTKTDLIVRLHPALRDLMRDFDAEKLSDIDERSREADAIEGRLYSILEDLLIFRNLVNMMNDLSFNFIAVSVDATAAPLVGNGNDDAAQEAAPRQLAPWRFTEIFRFGF
jgi:hypothetical protein